MGLGSIVGTGVFLSTGLGAHIVGSGVLIAIALAAPVAIFNGLSSAQLAAVHPVSGGTYEYGYQFLNPMLGHAAGWLFLFAKSASAATAALGFAGYAGGFLFPWLQAEFPDSRFIAWFASDPRILAYLIAVLCVAVVFLGIRRSNQANTIIVSTTLLTLTAFTCFVFFASSDTTATVVDFARLLPDFSGEGSLAALFTATALMFVAYTGYGRIATLGEEVREPRRVIPRAVILTLAVTMVLYIAVTAAAQAVLGAKAFGDAAVQTGAPLQAAAGKLRSGWLVVALNIGALTAMLGVLLNLVLGVSRVVLAMGRRGDLPGAFARVEESGNPGAAVLLTGLIIVVLILPGSVATAWSLSAFGVLVYYSITNLAALRIPDEQRLYPRLISILGLVSCLLLAFQVDRFSLLTGLGVLVAGVLWHLAARWKRREG